MKRTIPTMQVMLVGLVLASALACKKGKNEAEGDDLVAVAATMLHIEGTWVNSVALSATERPDGLMCLTIEAQPKTCRLKLVIEAFAGDCDGFAGVEFACFPKIDDQVVGFVDFAPVRLPAYGVGTLHLAVTFDAATLSGQATVVAEKTTAPAGATPERAAVAAPDLTGAWQLTRTPTKNVQWSTFDTTPQIYFEPATPSTPDTLGFWDSVGKQQACAATDTSNMPLFLQQDANRLPLRVDSGSHFDTDLDQWFAGLSSLLKARLRLATRYLSRYTPRPPCERSGDCLEGDFATLGPLDADTLRDRLTSSLLATNGVQFDCAQHTVPKNFNFMQCGASSLRACDVVKLSMDAPLGLELGSKGALELGEPPSGSRFDASFEWLCPDAYADLSRDDLDGADDVPAALLACRNEFLTLAPTAYKQAVILEDWYNLSDMDYMLRCNAKGPTAEQQSILTDLAASCTPEVWRSSTCNKAGLCETKLSCPYGRADGQCVDQGAFVGNIAGRLAPLQLHLGTDAAFLLSGDRTGAAAHTVDGVALLCSQRTHHRIYGVGSGNQISGIYVHVAREACEAGGEEGLEPTAGDFFEFSAERLP